MKSSVFAGAFMFLLLLVACNSKDDDKSKHQEEEAYDEYQYLTDSVEGKAVSHDCAIVFCKLQEMQWKWEDIKSPSQLVRARLSWRGNVTDVKKSISQLKGDERHMLDSAYNVVIKLYNVQLQKYSVPASGVLANLKYCSKRLDEVQTADEMERFRSCRIGVLREIEGIHLCVEPSSRDIPKVKRLAATVKEKYEEKCAKLGLKE